MYEIMITVGPKSMTNEILETVNLLPMLKELFLAKLGRYYAAFGNTFDGLGITMKSLCTQVFEHDGKD